MPKDEYSYFFMELPHMILIITLGFLELFLFLPLILSHFYNPTTKIDILFIFTSYWKTTLLSWSDINATFFLLLILALSYFLGYVFIGLYDFFGSKIINSLSWLLDSTICLICNSYATKKYYYRRIEEAKKYSEKNYLIGTKKYSKFQFELYDPKNKNYRNYYNWEFIKDVSCEYLAFLDIIFIAIFSFFLIFNHFELFEINDKIILSSWSILLIYVLAIISLKSLIYGHLFYGSARFVAENQAFDDLV